MTLRQQVGGWVYRHLPVSRRTFDIVRFELRFLRQRWLNALLPGRRAKLRRLHTLRHVSLNVGSGGRGRPDWINFDASPHHRDLYCCFDIRRPLPFADGAVQRILAEHVLEHLDYRNEVPRVLAEFHRVLEPGGVARIIVPDVERFLRAYVSASQEAWRGLGFTDGARPGGMETPMEMVNHVFHQGGEHCFGWDFATMERALRRAGFSHIVRQEAGRSVDPEAAIDQPNHAAYSLYVDAVK